MEDATQHDAIETDPDYMQISFAAMNERPASDLERQERIDRKHQAQNSPDLREFLIRPRMAMPDLAEKLERALDSAQREEDIQQFLQAHPVALSPVLSGGHGRWVIPKARLGAEFCTDFLLADACSFGLQWTAVELESPLRKPFTTRHDPSHWLTHAIQQIQSWRSWLEANRDYVQRPKAAQGQGLIDLDDKALALIVIGRRNSFAPETDATRRRIQYENRISVHSYDWLLDQLRG